jgi:hypothetical protein
MLHKFPVKYGDFQQQVENKDNLVEHYYNNQDSVLVIESF